MPFQEFVCTGCNLQTISSFDLANKPHLDCSGEFGYWLELPEKENRGYEFAFKGAMSGWQKEAAEQSVHLTALRRGLALSILFNVILLAMVLAIIGGR
jgi:hypothetical protein